MEKVTKKPVTFDEFCYLVKDGQKADLIDGVIHMASPDNTDANRLETWLLRLIGDFVELKDLGEVYHSRVAFRLSDENSPEPDIGFVRKDRLQNVKRWGVHGHPDLAIEIVSPESVDRDYHKKRSQYEKFGVEEYWIVDEITESVLWLARNSKGKFREIKPKKGVLHSRVLPGFWLRPQWLWQDPRPSKFAVLKEILPEMG